MKRILLLGATGSVGRHVLDEVREHSEDLKLVGIAGKKSIAALSTLAQKCEVPYVAISQEISREESSLFPSNCQIFIGEHALEDLVESVNCDMVVVAVSGIAALAATLKAIRKGITIALASKEILVIAGEWIMAEARKYGATLLPLDSEHNAIFQCLETHLPFDASALRRVWLTASGGPFLRYSREKMASITWQQALRHPVWRMGPKISVDSATLANKGLEFIEAKHLFDLQAQQIEVVIHPQSYVHSMVEWIDGSIMAQLAAPSMRFPIHYCLFYPERVASSVQTLSFYDKVQMDFEAPDEAQFPCLQLAKESLSRGNAGPIVFNASDEAAVEAFLSSRLNFLEIPIVIERTMDTMLPMKASSVEDALEVDHLSRKRAEEEINKLIGQRA
jgi:1-deoxy-D-xylulose-5-phosphate reductoisomerase